MKALRRSELIIMGLIAIAVVVTGALIHGPGPSTTSFVVATAALAGVAWIVSFATEQLGESFGPEVTGLMQSTLGNLPEFFVVLFALSAGQVVVAQTSIIGSILGNALLILGIAIIVGARASEDGVMRFSGRLPSDTSMLLLLAVFIIVLLGISTVVDDRAADNAREISIIGAICLLIVYVGWVWDYVRRGAAQADPRHSGPPRLPPRAAGLLLAVAGVAAALVSDWFVQGLEPAIEEFGISEAFAGLVIVGIAGNAVENTTGIVLAAKGRSELAVSVIKNSVSQIAVFLFPALVLVSMFFTEPLTFAMAPIYIGALALTAMMVRWVTSDGEARAWEGLALVAFYVIIASVVLFE